MTQAISDRDEVARLLPFWVNGSLVASEAARVEATLVLDADLRSEAKALGALRTMMQTPEPFFSPGEFGLMRLQRAIALESRPRVWRLRSAATAALVAALALIGIYVTLTSQADKPDIYRQASGQSPASILTVSFRPDATEDAIEKLLMRQGLTIVDGPSALRLYRIDVGKDQDPATVALTLRSESSVIESVEVSE